MNTFAFQKDAPTKHDCLRFSAVCISIRTPFADFAGLFSTSSGQCSRSVSPTSSGPSVYSAFPRLTLSRRLITRHSPPIPPCMFDVSLPPISPWTFSISSLPTPRSVSDCRRLDAMDRSHRRCVCPVIDAVHYRSVWCFPDELQGICRCYCPHFLRAIFHRGASKPLRGAQGSRRFVGCRRWTINGAIVPRYVEQDSTGKTLRVMRLGGSVVAIMIGEWMNCFDNSLKRPMICSEVINFLKTM
jgi:hypothetical protein